MVKEVMLTEYIDEILQRAQYVHGEDVDCIVAFVEDLPGCMTQGKNVDEATELLREAIELWVVLALKDAEEVPIINGRKLVISGPPRPESAYA